MDADNFLANLQREQRGLARSSDHYRQIGQALSILESARWRVGIVALFPTERVRTRRSLFSGTVESFIREELTGVPTTTLEFYVEDLDNLTDEASSLESLSIKELSFLERTGVFLIVAPLLYLISGFFLMTQLGTASAWLAALLPLVTYLSLVSILTSDTYRRASFSIVLGREILRRRGADTPGSSSLQICPT
jgi:hypothetical protein